MPDWNEERARRLLPPIGALQSFAAAARHGSFSRAAAEVGLGQSAVSRQVALLEDWMRVPLFERRGRRVGLTPAGRAYAEAVTPALADIRRATAAAMSAGRPRPLAIATLPSFGMRWLAPRLPRLTQAHPEVVMGFTARADEFDLSLEEFDAAVHYGAPDWPGAMLDRLFGESNIAVVAPDLLRDRPVAVAADLLALPLLVQSNRLAAWDDWLAVQGVPGHAPAPAPALVFDQFQMLAQAAVSGAGAALLPSFLIEPELKAGLLVAPKAAALPGRGAYYLAYEQGRLADPRFRAFRDWMLDEAGATASRDLGTAISSGG